MKSWPLLIAALSLGACAADNSSAVLNAGYKATSAQITLRDYPQTFQTQLADELQGAPANSATATAVTDYGQLRRAVCAARAWKGGPCPTMKTAGAGK